MARKKGKATNWLPRTKHFGKNGWGLYYQSLAFH